MKKVKIATESDKSFDTFLKNEHYNEAGALIFSNHSEILQFEGDEKSTEKHKTLFILLKQIFLFLPGTFLLYLVGFVFALIFIDIFISQRPLETLPPSAPFQIILLVMFGFLGTFMTWFGLGDLKNKKHLSIPASVFTTGAFLAVIFKATETIFPAVGKLLEEFNHYYFYLLPLILIIPVLTKSIVDRKVEDE